MKYFDEPVAGAYSDKPAHSYVVWPFSRAAGCVRSTTVGVVIEYGIHLAMADYQEIEEFCEVLRAAHVEHIRLKSIVEASI